jgi:hypothetical protein
VQEHQSRDLYCGAHLLSHVFTNDVNNAFLVLEDKWLRPDKASDKDDVQKGCLAFRGASVATTDPRAVMSLLPVPAIYKLDDKQGARNGADLAGLINSRWFIAICIYGFSV